MKVKSKIWFLILSILCFLGSAFSYFGLLMIGSFKVSPSYPPERADYNMKIYFLVFFVSILLGIIFAVSAFSNHKRKN